MMKERGVKRVDVAFVPLQVITILEIFDSVPLLLRCGKKLVVREERGFARSHIGEDRSPPLDAWISAVLNRPSKLSAPIDLSWHIHNLSMDIVKPTVIDASESAILYTAITQVGSPVGTV
jgi:hypothetical protein